METYKVKTCEEETWVSLGLFTDVGNSSWIRNEATGGRMEAAVLDPSLVKKKPQIPIIYPRLSSVLDSKLISSACGRH